MHVRLATGPGGLKPIWILAPVAVRFLGRYSRNRAPDLTWVIDLAVLGMEAVMPKSDIGCNMGDRVSSFWDGSCYAENEHRI